MVMEKEQILAQARDMLEQKKYDILTGQVDEFHRLSEIKDTMKLDFSSLEYGLCLNVLQLEDLAENDKKLMNFATRIREEWKYKCLLKTTPFMIAPFWGDKERYESWGGQTLYSGYEMLYRPINHFVSKKVEGYQEFNCLIKSGQSALYFVLLLIAQKEMVQSHTVATYASYFSSVKMMSLLEKISDLRFQQIKNQSFLEWVENTDVFFLESQKASRNFGRLKIDELLVALRGIEFTNPKVILFDSTFQGNTFPLSPILEALKDKPLYIINVRSTSKLDQKGLEFCNGGLIEFYQSDMVQHDIEVWKENLLSMCSIAGVFPSYVELLMLDNGLSFQESDNYATDFLETCQHLSKQLPAGNSLCPRLDWEETAPYFNVQLLDNSIFRAELFYKVLSALIKDLGGKIFQKSSYGYRYLAVEYFVDIEDDQTTTRISPGVLKGYSYWSFICLWELLQDCRSYDLSLLIK